MDRRKFIANSIIAGVGVSQFPLRSLAGMPRLQKATIYDHILVAKDVCAWPKLAMTSSKKIAALIHNQPVHGSVGKSGIELWLGDPAGEKWSRQSIVKEPTPDTSYYNHAIGTNRSGDLVILTSGWTRNENGESNHYEKRGGAYLIDTISGISGDEGKTWKLFERVEANGEGINPIPFGTIALGENGILRVASFVFRPDDSGRVDTCYVLKSTDNGKSWRIDSIIGNYMQNETDIAYAGGNTWYALARKLNEGGHNTEFFVSSDDAQNWKSLGPLTQAGQHPGDILPCRDGRLIVTYGNRIADEYGIEAIISYDQGATWSEPVRLASTHNRDSGYPSSVELEDGTIVTGYYAKGGDLYENYYFGVVKWKLNK